MKLDEKLLGWQYILKDQCMQNELTDVKTVNMPNFGVNQDGKDWFVYTCNLNPGYHKLLIYDPELHRAFCKDFVVGLNRRDVYPEYPAKEVKKSDKAPNVWRTWHEDAQEDTFRSF